MQQLFLTAATAGAMLVGVVATARADEPEHRFYVQIQAGQDRQDDEAIRGATVTNLPRNLDLSFDDGRVYAAAIGVNALRGKWGRLRFDAELSQRQADLDTLFLNGEKETVRQGSHVQMTAGMLNGYYDTPAYFDRLRFYVGAGAGIASIDHQVRYLITRSTGNIAIAIPTSEPTWAYQLVGGAEFAVTSHWSLLADVRKVTFGDTQVQRFNLTTGALDSVLDADKSSTSVTAGIRYSF